MLVVDVLVVVAATVGAGVMSCTVVGEAAVEGLVGAAGVTSIVVGETVIKSAVVGIGVDGPAVPSVTKLVLVFVDQTTVGMEVESWSRLEVAVLFVEWWIPVVVSAVVGPTDAVAAVVRAAVVVLGESTTVGFIVVTPSFLV